ncbi:DCC1-like thiol-disulfide oxidoreductase family protein [Xanthobacter oligotrophicus]|uniref:DCC1-like thiol-disulfide oxidoreductase family protein n=1 Tax=Xanthobacter oligotrophicus TaxID=2607286 RepID=A0ABW6ZSY6_9HYPH
MSALPPDQDLIVFDGVCVFCSGFARFIVRYDRKQRFRFVVAQSEAGRALYRRYGLDPDLMETNIVVVNRRAHVRMRAFGAAMGAIGWPWAVFQPLVWLPAGLTDRLYDAVARNRYRFGRRACTMPSQELRARLLE